MKDPSWRSWFSHGRAQASVEALPTRQYHPHAVRVSGATLDLPVDFHTSHAN